MTVSHSEAELTGNAFDTIERAVSDLAKGRPVVVVDDADRENEGDLILVAKRSGGAAFTITVDARLPELKAFARTHGLPLISIADLIEYRRREEGQVEIAVHAPLPTRYGKFKAIGARRGIGAQILTELGVRTIRLLTNNSTKRAGLEGYGIRVTDRVAMPAPPTEDNISYLVTKRDRCGHEVEGLPDTVELDRST